MKLYSSGLVARALLTLALFLAGAGVLRAATMIDLVAYVTYSLLDDQNPAQNLADGSIVYIIGSSDAVIDPMATYGGTNCIASSVTGDDVMIGSVAIGDGISSNDSGRFYTGDYQFDADVVDYMYIRFFNTTNAPVSDYVAWGTSEMYAATNHPWGVEFLDFAPSNSYATTNHCNFVVIPEPGTLGLGLFALAAGAVLYAARGRHREEWEHTGKS